MLVISAAKKIGLTLKELNEFRAQDLIDLLHEFTRDKEESTTRDATPEEYDRMFGAGGLS